MQNMLLVRLCADACGAVADHDAFCAEGKIVHATHSDSTGIYVDGLRSMLDALQLRLLEGGKTFNSISWVGKNAFICVPILFTLLHPLVFTHTDTNCIF